MPPAAAIEKSADQAADEIGIFAGVFDRQIGHQQRLRVEDLHKILGLLLILRDGDLVKFAKATPPAEENEADYLKAYYFVEETKLVEESTPTEGPDTMDN